MNDNKGPDNYFDITNRTYLNKEPKIKAMLEEGRKKLLNKEFDEAIKDFKTIVEMTENYQDIQNEAKYYLGICYLDSNMPLRQIQEHLKII